MWLAGWLHLRGGCAKPIRFGGHMGLKRQRIVGIDICRSFAIIAAMGSHSLIAAGAFEHNQGTGMTLLRFFMQLSPPYLSACSDQCCRSPIGPSSQQET